MSAILPSKTLPVSVTRLTSETYKQHKFYQPYLESCYFSFDYQVFSLSFTQFFLAMILTLRKNFRRNTAIVSETVSPIPEVIPHCRIEYALKALRKKGIVNRNSKNVFEFPDRNRPQAGIPYSVLLNTIISINEDNFYDYKALLYYALTSNGDYTALQTSLRIRKASACALASGLSLHEDLIRTTLCKQVHDHASKRRGNSPKNRTPECEPNTHAQKVPDSVPISQKTVPNSPHKYTSTNNITNQSFSHTQAHYDWAHETIDRLFQNNFNSHTISIPEQLTTRSHLIDSIKPLLSTSDSAAVFALGIAAGKHSYFASRNIDRLFKTCAEILLTIRAKGYASKIENPRAYFFKCLHNAFLTSDESYPLLRKSLSEKRKMENQTARKEADRNREMQEERLYDAAVAEYELQTGRVIQGLFDPVFSRFFHEFKTRRSRRHTMSRGGDNSPDFNPQAVIERYECDTPVSRPFATDLGTDRISNVVARIIPGSSSEKPRESRARCGSKSEWAIERSEVSSKSNVFARLLRGKWISEDEYNGLPEHLRERCESVSREEPCEIAFRLAQTN